MIPLAAALASYRKAIAAGNLFSLAYMARLVSRSAHADRAEAVWDRFFAALADAPATRSAAASIGEVLHWYADSRLRQGFEPKHIGTLQHHLTAIVAHHQALLEHATGDEQLARLDAVATWMKGHLRPKWLRPLLVELVDTRSALRLGSGSLGSQTAPVTKGTKGDGSFAGKNLPSASVPCVPTVEPHDDMA